jgi:hypothetical protein
VTAQLGSGSMLSGNSRVQGLATDVNARLGGAMPEAAAAESTAAVTNQRGLDQGLLPVPVEEILTGNLISFGRRLQNVSTLCAGLLDGAQIFAGDFRKLVGLKCEHVTSI